jgi:hypothetical protein
MVQSHASNHLCGFEDAYDEIGRLKTKTTPTGTTTYIYNVLRHGLRLRSPVLKVALQSYCFFPSAFRVALECSNATFLFLCIPHSESVKLTKGF